MATFKLYLNELAKALEINTGLQKEIYSDKYSKQ